MTEVIYYLESKMKTFYRLNIIANYLFERTLHLQNQ